MQSVPTTFSIASTARSISTGAGSTITSHLDVLNVGEILAKSSDVGAIKIALQVGRREFYDYIRAFGFGSQTGVDMPGESRGMLAKVDNWGATSIASISMGQEVAVTPIQLVSAVSAIANGGTYYKPHVDCGSATRRKSGAGIGALAPG